MAREKTEAQLINLLQRKSEQVAFERRPAGKDRSHMDAWGGGSRWRKGRAKSSSLVGDSKRPSHLYPEAHQYPHFGFIVPPFAPECMGLLSQHGDLFTHWQTSVHLLTA